MSCAPVMTSHSQGHVFGNYRDDAKKMTRKDRLWVRGLKGLVASIIATLAVRWAAVPLSTFRPSSPPLGGSGPDNLLHSCGRAGSDRCLRPRTSTRGKARVSLSLDRPRSSAAVVPGRPGASGRRSCGCLPGGNPSRGRSAHADACRRCHSHRLVPDCKRPDGARRSERNLEAGFGWGKRLLMRLGDLHRPPDPLGIVVLACPYLDRFGAAAHVIPALHRVI